MTTADAIAALPLIPSEEELAIRASVRGICEGLGKRYAREIYEAGEPPTEAWRALAEKGFVGINIPRVWGGGGLGMSGLAIVGEEVAAAGVPTLMLVVSSAIGGSILARHGTEQQNERWLRGIAAGTTKFAFAITEPDAGTNTHNLRTEIKRDGDRYLLNGQKVFISAVEEATEVLVIARMRGSDGQLGMPVLAVMDVDAPGFSREVIPMPYLGADKQWTLFFEDVVLEPDRLIGGESGGLGAVFDGLNPERIIAAAISVGAGRRALEKACAYAREREVWGVPIGTHQALAHPLAKAKIELELARLMIQKACVLYDAGDPGAGEAANMAKFAAAEAGVKCLDRAIQCHGGNGIAVEYGLTDLWWVVRLTQIAPVSREMVLNFVAEHSLRLPRSY
jgi:alkylation response protein AidB-like acyl-CoA dehydrogenase